MATLTVEGFDEKAGDFVGEKIMINGTVDHTCKHSGKRMVIIGENPDFSVKIEAGEVAQFNRELEGSEVEIIAVVTELKMDEKYLDEWEEEVIKGKNGITGKGAWLTALGIIVPILYLVLYYS